MFPTARDRAGWVAAGRPPLRLPPADDRFGPHGLPAWMTGLSALPTSPGRLAGLISARKIEGGPPGPAEDFAQVGDLLRQTCAPPRLRSALFQVAAHIPGVTILPAVTDPAGRPGVAVAYFSYPPSGERTLSELIFDPATAGLLAEQTVTVNAATHTRTLTNWTVYLRAGVANSITSIPRTTTIP